MAILEPCTTRDLTRRFHDKTHSFPSPKKQLTDKNFWQMYFFSIFQNLERKEKHQAMQLEQLTKKQIFLKWRCEQLISYNEALCKRRSVSECSTSTISSTNSYELTRSSSSICESGMCKINLLTHGFISTMCIIMRVDTYLHNSYCMYDFLCAHMYDLPTEPLTLFSTLLCLILTCKFIDNLIALKKKFYAIHKHVCVITKLTLLEKWFNLLHFVFFIRKNRWSKSGGYFKKKLNFFSNISWQFKNIF